MYFVKQPLLRHRSIHREPSNNRPKNHSDYLRQSDKINTSEKNDSNHSKNLFTIKVHRKQLGSIVNSQSLLPNVQQDPVSKLLGFKKITYRFKSSYLQEKEQVTMTESQQILMRIQANRNSNTDRKRTTLQDEIVTSKMQIQEYDDNTQDEIQFQDSTQVEPKIIKDRILDLLFLSTQDLKNKFRNDEQTEKKKAIHYSKIKVPKINPEKFPVDFFEALRKLKKA